ncbi:uncharacterized protein LOC136031430 [Artemia franciscana]|uniref:uncharacterized protein LOC136031430 n=1 Tax=Artemia franciscana TaxID=6661 RepID=UPI0032DBE0D6
MDKSPPDLIRLLAKLTIGDNTFVTIKCVGGDVIAKRSLLSGVSDVFQRMFEADFIEKRTNVVVIDDVHFLTLNFIIQCYEKGTMPCLKKLDLKEILYTVEKYNLLCIKEEIAEKLIDVYRQSGNMDTLEKIFSYFSHQRVKEAALRELAINIVEGGKIPDFVISFSVEDFTKLSKICYSQLNLSKKVSRHDFLQMFCSWVSNNPEERSVAAIELISIINLQSLHVCEILTVFENLTFKKPFQNIKMFLEESLRCILVAECNSENIRKFHTSILESLRPIGSINCTKCGHNDKTPFHFSRKCRGFHSDRGVLIEHPYPYRSVWGRPILNNLAFN